jgi:hypothetical protein
MNEMMMTMNVNDIYNRMMMMVLSVVVEQKSSVEDVCVCDVVVQI